MTIQPSLPQLLQWYPSPGSLWVKLQRENRILLPPPRFFLLMLRLQSNVSSCNTLNSSPAPLLFVTVILLALPPLLLALTLHSTLSEQNWLHEGHLCSHGYYPLMVYPNTQSPIIILPYTKLAIHFTTSGNPFHHNRPHCIGSQNVMYGPGPVITFVWAISGRGIAPGDSRSRRHPIDWPDRESWRLTDVGLSPDKWVLLHYKAIDLLYYYTLITLI